MKYKVEQINLVIKLLNQLEIKGIENANRIAMIASILNEPEKENENGEHS